MADKAIINKIISISKINNKDAILEIGPGLGALTEHFVKKAKAVWCIEIDERFKPYLSKLAEKHSNLHIKYGNALKLKWPKFDKIIANLPFNLTEPLFMQLMIKLAEYKFKYGIFTVSKHFEQTLEKSRFGIIMPCYFNLEKLFDIPAKAFWPKPRISAILIKIKPKTETELKPIQLLLKHLLSQRKTKVKNALRNSMIKYRTIEGKKFTKRQCKLTIAESGLLPRVLEKHVINLSSAELEHIKNFYLQFLSLN